MAEKGAHLTQTSQIKPSIFDFVAQDSLNSLLYSAVKRIVDVLALRYPSFRKISHNFDEFFLVSHSLLQWHYLKEYGATFAESFYGLQRVPVKGKSNALMKKHLLLSLFFVTICPYLKMKFDKIAEAMYLDELPYTFEKKKVMAMKTVISANSSLNVLLQIINFVQHLRYLSGKSEVNSISLLAAGVKLRYADDPESINSSFQLRNFIPQLLRKSLEVSAFFFQFYQWWQTERVTSIGSVPVPPPPPPSEETKDEELRSICPICNKSRIAETVLSVSGYVFCFRCITSYLSEHNKCPVTNLPATVNSLVRLYPPK